MWLSSKNFIGSDTGFQRAGERGTVARTVMRGKAITGSGGSHDEACEVLKDEVQRHLINLKVNTLLGIQKKSGKQYEREMYFRRRRMQEGRRNWSGWTGKPCLTSSSSWPGEMRRVGRKGFKVSLLCPRCFLSAE